MSFGIGPLRRFKLINVESRLPLTDLAIHSCASRPTSVVDSIMVDGEAATIAIPNTYSQ